jgi:hypothetical protein
MPKLSEEQADRIVAGWRSGEQTVEGWENPAGPLFAGGEYAEAEITMEAIMASTGCGGNPGGTAQCSACTASAGILCC